MEVDFDKQVDAILKELVKGNTFADPHNQLHLDADEISAFAENELPEKARLRAIEHLADCSRCRSILTTSSLSGFETESETIHDEIKKLTVVSTIPWYKKLFAFPQLTYTMGGLVVLFTGVIGILIFLNSDNPEMNIAQIESTEKTSNLMNSEIKSEKTIAPAANYSANSAANVGVGENSQSAEIVGNAPVSDKEIMPKPSAKTRKKKSWQKLYLNRWWKRNLKQRRIRWKLKRLRHRFWQKINLWKSLTKILPDGRRKCVIEAG